MVTALGRRPVYVRDRRTGGAWHSLPEFRLSLPAVARRWPEDLPAVDHGHKTGRAKINPEELRWFAPIHEQVNASVRHHFLKRGVVHDAVLMLNDRELRRRGKSLVMQQERDDVIERHEVRVGAGQTKIG